MAIARLRTAAEISMKYYEEPFRVCYDQMMDFSVDVWRQLEHNGTPIDQGQTMQ